jgi:carbon storage regulator CsrA
VKHNEEERQMLVLSRKEGEQIVVPECRLTVTVFDIHGERVRLGISAPAEVRVYRGEVLHPLHVPDVRQEAETPSLSEDTSMSARVLIADPDEYMLDTYRDYLEQHGFEVTTATTGLECVERLRECAPDLLVLEPSIPWGLGDGILAMMHEESDIPIVPVIVLTYGRDRGVLYRLAPFKIDDYQVKPLSAKRLAQRVRSLLAHHQDADAALLAGAEGLGGVQ